MKLYLFIMLLAFSGITSCVEFDRRAYLSAILRAGSPKSELDNFLDSTKISANQSRFNYLKQQYYFFYCNLIFAEKGVVSSYTPAYPGSKAKFSGSYVYNRSCFYIFYDNNSKLVAAGYGYEFKTNSDTTLKNMYLSFIEQYPDLE